MYRRVLMLACAAMMGTACASSGSAAGSASASPSTTTVRSSHNVIVADEMVGSESDNLYDTIRKLRPAFLRSRNQITPMSQQQNPVDVYVNGQRTEGLDALRTITTGTVKEVRFYEPQEANTRFGTGHDAGVIAVTLK